MTILRRNVPVVCGASYHLLGYQISQDSKIRFQLQVKSYISGWLFSKSWLLASYVSRHKAMAYDNPPSLRMYFLGGLRVFMALKALLCSGDDKLPQHWSVLRAINTLNSPKNYIRLLGGLLPIHSTRRRGAQGLMWGTRGPFPPATAMVGYGCVG